MIDATDDRQYALFLIHEFQREVHHSLSCGDPHGMPYVFLFELSDLRVRKVAELIETVS